MSLKIIYRGGLDSCNYDCSYCPFAKQRSSRQQLEQDQQQLLRFETWLQGQNSSLRVLFTPWGEALIWPYYQDTLVRLSHRPVIQSVAIQTNLSCALDWLSEAETKNIYLWASFHPEEVDFDKFIGSCNKVLEYGANLSVGLVGLKSNFNFLDRLQRALPASVYLWINAYKDEPDYYSQSEIDYLQSYDSFFTTNLTNHASQGKFCASGESVFSVDGEGNMRRCHFIDNVIGNIYESGFENSLYSRTCTNSHCDCYLGYVHLNELDFKNRFGENYFERYRGSENI